jgi:hypothetical protein
MRLQGPLGTDPTWMILLASLDLYYFLWCLGTNRPLENPIRPVALGPVDQRIHARGCSR